MATWSEDHLFGIGQNGHAFGAMYVLCLCVMSLGVYVVRPSGRPTFLVPGRSQELSDLGAPGRGEVVRHGGTRPWNRMGVEVLNARFDWPEAELLSSVGWIQGSPQFFRVKTMVCSRCSLI